MTGGKQGRYNDYNDFFTKKMSGEVSKCFKALNHLEVGFDVSAFTFTESMMSVTNRRLLELTQRDSAAAVKSPLSIDDVLENEEANKDEMRLINGIKVALIYIRDHEPLRECDVRMLQNSSGLFSMCKEIITDMIDEKGYKSLPKGYLDKAFETCEDKYINLINNFIDNKIEKSSVKQR